MIDYQHESSEERKTRRNKAIKALFQHLVINESMPCMEAYEAVGYQFYLSACEIRRILASMNKSAQKAHNSPTQKQYFCSVFRKRGAVTLFINRESFETCVHPNGRSIKAKHKTFKTMATLNVETIKLIGNGVLDAKHVAVLLQADMLAEEAAIDALQMNRVCAIMSDAQDLLVKGDQKNGQKGLAEFGIEVVQALHPEEYESGKEFEHGGGKYYVEKKEIPILVDKEGKPYEGKDFAKVYAIDAQKAELTKKQSRLTVKRKEAITQLMEKHPYLEKETKRTLKVKR